MLAAGDDHRHRVVLAHDDVHAVREVGRDLDALDLRIGRDRAVEVALADVQRGHVARGVLEDAGDAGGIGPGDPRDGDVVDRHQRRITQPEPAQRKEDDHGGGNRQDAR